MAGSFTPQAIMFGDDDPRPESTRTGPATNPNSADVPAPGPPTGLGPPQAPSTPDATSPPKPDAPKPDVPKPDAQKPDVPNPDAPKPDAPNPDAPKPDAPKPDAQKPDAQKPDVLKPDAPQPDPSASPTAPNVKELRREEPRRAPHGTESVLDLLRRKREYLFAAWAKEAHDGTQKFKLWEDIQEVNRQILKYAQDELKSSKGESSDSVQRWFRELENVARQFGSFDDARPSLLEPLKVKPRAIRFDLGDEFNRRREQLGQQHVLLVSSYDRELLLDIESCVASPLTDYSKLVLNSAKNRYRNDDPVRFEDVWDWHDRAAKDASTELITFVHITEQRLKDTAERFVGQPDFSSHQCERLRAQGGYIVCLLFAAEIDDASLRSDPLFWQVDWLPAVVRASAPPDRDVDQLLRTLQEQRRRGDWPANERQFWREFRNFWNTGGYVALEREIDARNREPQGGGQVLNLNSAGFVHRMAVFVGLSFPGISVPGLQTIMHELLAGEKHEEQVTERKTDAAGNLRDLSKQRSVDALAYWRDHQDDVLYDCGLRRFTDGDGRAYLDFDSRQRRQYQESFDRRLSLFRFRQVERLYRSGLLYDGSQPRDLVSQLTELTATMAREAPEHYGASWLLDTLSEAQRPAVVENIGDAAPPAIHQFFEWLVAEAGRETVFYPRFGILCAKLLRFDRTRAEVEKLLQFLIQAGAESQAPLFAWRIVRQLRDAPQFDYFAWIRRILNGAPAAVRWQVLQALLADAMDSDARFETVGRQLYSWLPATAEQALGTTERYAAGFLFEYFKSSSLACLRQRGGKRGESRHPVYSCPRDNEGNIQQRVEWLAKWLSHPAVVSGASLILRDFLQTHDVPIPDEVTGGNAFGIDVHVIVADVVEGWQELADMLDDASARQATEANEAFLRELLRLADSESPKRGQEFRRLVRQRWNDMIMYYTGLLGMPASVLHNMPDSAAARPTLIAKYKRLQSLNKLLTR